jgi:hypothetical protein
MVRARPRHVRAAGQAFDKIKDDVAKDDKLIFDAMKASNLYSEIQKGVLPGSGDRHLRDVDQAPHTLLARSACWRSRCASSKSTLARTARSMTASRSATRRTATSRRCSRGIYAAGRDRGDRGQAERQDRNPLGLLAAVGSARRRMLAGRDDRRREGRRQGSDRRGLVPAGGAALQSERGLAVGLGPLYPGPARHCARSTN